jgi:hypothetical protein
MSAFNLGMGFTNSTFNIFGMMKFPIGWIGLIALLICCGLVAFIAYLAYRSYNQSLNRTDLNVKNNGSHLIANFPVDTGTNGKTIPSIVRTVRNQSPIRQRRPLREPE